MRLAPQGTTRHHRFPQISRTLSACKREQAHGRLATTLPFSHTYNGVPYMRAVRRAASRARMSARSTRAASFGFRFRPFPAVFAFMDPTLSASVACLNCRKPPTRSPADDTWFGNSASSVKSAAEHPPSAHCDRLAAPCWLYAAARVGATQVVQITVQVNKSLNTVDAVQHHALELESKPPFLPAFDHS